MTRSALILTLLALCGLASAQAWRTAYERGLNAADRGEWKIARGHFLDAIASRGTDSEEPSRLSGPVTEPRIWRAGAPYSPNFSAAYTSYMIAMGVADGPERTSLLIRAGDELRQLIQQGQRSLGSAYTLAQIYTLLGDQESLEALEAENAESGYPFRVDRSVMTSEEQAAIESIEGQRSSTGPDGIEVITVQAGSPQAETGPQSLTDPTNLSGRVAPNPSKFALLIGNTESQLPDGRVSFAASDVQAMQETLTRFSGYIPENIDVVQNGTADQMRTAAQALAARLPENATVFIFVAGAGVNIDSSDFIAGVDATDPYITSAMIGKDELLRPFLAKGAKIFSFYEVGRQIINGRYFGQDVPPSGAISQMMGTMPGQPVRSVLVDGAERGVFSLAMQQVLGRFKSNQVPIMEFAWQVFYAMRGGNATNPGGGGTQTPTLPVLTYLSADSPF